MIRTILAILLFISLSTSKLISQDNSGLCYGKAMMPDVIELIKKSYPIYTGKDNTAKYLKWEEIVIQSEQLRWEERRNPNCLSDDPNDCLMVCSVSIPAVVKSYQVVDDLNATQEFEWQEFSFEKLIKKGGEEYVTVVCNDKIDPVFVSQITNQLKTRGYYEGPSYDVFSQSLKNALIKYQKENGLPEGTLDLVTLASLGFGYTANE